MQIFVLFAVHKCRTDDDTLLSEKSEFCGIAWTTETTFLYTTIFGFIGLSTAVAVVEKVVIVVLVVVYYYTPTPLIVFNYNLDIATPHSDRGQRTKTTFFTTTAYSFFC